MVINDPEVVAEVEAAFADYEAALSANDVARLDGHFWASGHTVRYGVGECLYGQEEILAYRKGNARGTTKKAIRLVTTTFGRDFATVSIEFTRDGLGKIGRQQQSWVRLPEGWRVVAAHVSMIDPPAGG
jgi:hypothetical protein